MVRRVSAKGYPKKNIALIGTEAAEGVSKAIAARMNPTLRLPLSPRNILLPSTLNGRKPRQAEAVINASVASATFPKLKLTTANPIATITAVVAASPSTPSIKLNEFVATTIHIRSKNVGRSAIAPDDLHFAITSTIVPSTWARTLSFEPTPDRK